MRPAPAAGSAWPVCAAYFLTISRRYDEHLADEHALEKKCFERFKHHSSPAGVRRYSSHRLKHLKLHRRAAEADARKWHRARAWARSCSLRDIVSAAIMSTRALQHQSTPPVRAHTDRNDIPVTAMRYSLRRGENLQAGSQAARER